MKLRHTQVHQFKLLSNIWFGVLEKLRHMKRQFMLLLHGHKCIQKEQSGSVICDIPHCGTIKNVLKHMKTCNLGKECTVAHCVSSRQIISHWKNCIRNDCPVCSQIKNVQARHKQPGKNKSKTGCDDSKDGNGLHYIGENISFYPLKELGHGSHAVVYEGRFGQFSKKPVAIKLVKCLNEQDAKATDTEIQNIYREIKTMETLSSPSKCTNIIDFIDSFIDKNRVYLAFELARGTLHDYVASSNVAWQNESSGHDITRGVVDGLKYTHRKRIVHRDIKPANIFIVEHSEMGLKAVIGDYGTAKTTTGSMFTLTGKMGSLGYIAPEIWKAMASTPTDAFGSRCSKQSDIFSLALVIHFTLSLGRHLFGNEMTTQVEIAKASSPDFEHILSNINSFAYVHILRRMLNNDPTKRPRIEEVREHPVLLTSDKVMEFFVNKSDEFKNMIKADPWKANLLEDPSLITNIDWMKRLPVHMQTYLRSYKLNNRKQPLYKGKETSIRHLLRAVRNTKAHFTEYPQNAQVELGNFPDGHVAFWLNVCPKLLMHIYDKLGPP